MSETLASLATFAILVAAIVGIRRWAEKAEHDRSAYVGLFLLFGIPGSLVLLTGLAVIWNDTHYGAALIGTGLGLSLPLLQPVRVHLARVLPIDSASPVDMAALSVFFGVLGFLGLPSDASGTDSPSVIELISQLALEIGLAYGAVGFWWRRNFTQASSRLGLTPLTPRLLVIAVGFVTLGWLIGVAGGVLTEVFQPDQAGEIEETTDDITANIENPVGAVILGISAGVGEELLFRGALQPKFGLILTSLAFAFVHMGQYGLSFVVLGLFGIGLILGIERQRYGTTAAIITHALFDILVVLAQTFLE